MILFILIKTFCLEEKKKSDSMRLIPTSNLLPGMILGKNLYDNHNSLLLKKGHALSEKEIRRIGNLRYQGLYIADDVLQEAEIPENTEDINDVLRNNAVSAIRELFSIVSSQNMVMKKSFTVAQNAVGDIVEEIVLNKNATYSMTDLKIFDDYTYFHSVNVTVIAVILGFAMGLSRTNLYKLGLGGLLHDIGKIFIPKEILEKPGKLTDEEFGIIQKHSQKGYEYLKQMKDFPFESNLAVLTHHEQYGGQGYPGGMKGEKIPLFGRILMVADVFDALISDRPYRKALLPSDAVEYIVGGCGILFDPTIVDVFIKKISPYPIGTHVILSNGLKGIVVSNRPGFGLRPKIRVSASTGDAEFYDLSSGFFDVTITEIAY
ncbi:hypothetical protein SDC9_112450 [bioreactor metagenome]|uniref:HD-GYP domain-containing protein n=1 Tax=bioreactor metagenome TaxID=1076179 RepID=A0A645BQP7_9ZZZZ